MRLAAAALLLLACASAPGASEPPIPQPRGFVTDSADVLDAESVRRIERQAQALRTRTGAEIAVLTVQSTAPLDDFAYALRVAEAWGIGRRGEDTGVLVLLAVRDRRLRILVGYGLEEILPDGLVGEIQDTEMLPAFRAGRYGEGVRRGVAAIAERIAADRGIRLDDAALPPRAADRPGLPPFWALLGLVVVATIVYLALAGADGPRIRHGRGRAPVRMPRGGFPVGGGFGGRGGGFGGFGGFGGGRFGGGGAGRGW